MSFLLDLVLQLLLKVRLLSRSAHSHAVREEAGRAEQHIITEAAPNELKLGRVRKVMRAGHRQGGGVGGVRRASFAKTTS